jgi:Tol biopolymer transport system component
VLPEGYINNPTATSYGVVFTDESHSAVYLSNNNKTTQLFTSPGCGRYFTVSKDGEKIGFKSIDKNTGLQAPAVYNLKTGKLTLLENYTQNAGQVSFADDGTVAYTMENNIVIVKNGSKRTYELGVYSNRAPISPDGKYIVYKDYSEQLWLFDIAAGSKRIITDSKDGYANVQWSPDSRKIVYTTNGLQIYTSDLNAGTSSFIGEGENPVWAGNSNQIVYSKKEIDYNNARLTNSDIYIAEVKSGSVRKVTNTSDVFEMDPSYDAASNSIIYQTYDKREVKSVSGSTLLKIENPLKVVYYYPETVSSKDKKDLPDYVHIHQVWDTREDWSEPYSCCGATSCMEAIASFGILPPAPFTTHGHVSNFGIYISDSYTYNGYTYSGFTGRWPTGGHGCLWNGSGSPYSNAASYLQKHRISSSRTDDVPWNYVTTEINGGHPYIVCSTQLTAGHIVMIVGIYGTQHSVYCNDPYGDKNAGSYGNIRNGKNAIYDWSDANTGHEAICPVVWAVTAHFSQTTPPTVLSYYPANNQDSVKSVDTLSINFSQPMDVASTEAAFSISPAVQGTIFWTNNNFTLNFKPNVTYDKATQYTVNLTTAAKNVFNINLGQNLSFKFKTRFRDRLKIENTYPVDMQNKISQTAQFRFQFDVPVPQAAVVGNFELYDWNNTKLSIANGKVFTQNGKGFVYFEPKVKMEKDKNYYLLLKSKICDYEGIPIGDSVIISFHTDADAFQTGTVIDNFESVANWKVQKGDTLGIDTVATVFTAGSDRKVNGSYSGKLSYTFTGNNGTCCVNNINTPAISGTAGSEFGVWVFGDLSMNTLEYWFNVDGRIVKEVIDTVNWTGWKLKRIPFSTIGGSCNIALNSIVIKQNANGVKTGLIYFDDAQYNIISAVEEDNNNALVKEFALAQNYPNPFNPSTTIKCKIQDAGVYSLKVYNLLGQEVAVLNNGELKAGEYKFNFNASNLPSGVYIYQLRGANVNISHKMMLLK